MLATAHTTALLGLEARPVRVEVACTRGPGWFEMVGLADGAVRESRVRVGSALAQLGILMGEHRITVNLAPISSRSFIVWRWTIGFGELKESAANC
jgi:magnesium chelatase family protein